MVRNQKFTVSYLACPWAVSHQLLAKHQWSAKARPSIPQAPRQGARFSSPSLPLLGPGLVVFVRVSSPAFSDLLPWPAALRALGWSCAHHLQSWFGSSWRGAHFNPCFLRWHIKDAVNFGSPGLACTLISFLMQDLAGTLYRCISRSPVISSPAFCLLCHDVVFLEGSKNDYEQLNLEVIRFGGMCGLIWF